MMPSPQVVAHALGSPLQVQPRSTVQTAEQPSPPLASPSSQVSAPAMMPSPQVVLHTLGVAVLQVQPRSTVQVAEQPSPGVVLP
jgi:hypothetical protein